MQFTTLTKSGAILLFYGFAYVPHLHDDDEKCFLMRQMSFGKRKKNVSNKLLARVVCARLKSVGGARNTIVGAIIMVRSGIRL